MFSTPPRDGRHYESMTVRTRRAWKKELDMENTNKEQTTRDVQSEILQKGNPETAFSVITRPKTEGDYLKNYAHSLKPVSSIKHSNSSKSFEAKKKQLEFKAAQQQAEIEEKAIRMSAELQKSLVQQKLAADIAALESASSRSRRSSQYQPTEINSAEKVQQWLENSQEKTNNKGANATQRRPSGDGVNGATATMSLLSADIADQIGLHGQQQTLRVRGARDSELTCKSERIKCKITNASNDSFKLCVTKINELNLPMQKLSNLKIKDYEHFKNLNDTCSENVKNEPSATLTPLGWCVHGVCYSNRQYSSSRSECALITVEQLMHQLPAPASSCPARHACPRDTNTSPLVCALTGACETTADASLHHTLTTVNEETTIKECKFCYRSADAIHTDIKDEKRLYELDRKSFIFKSIGVYNKPRQNKDELKAIQIVENSTRFINGKWEVGLPWKDENVKLAKYFSNAYRRLKISQIKMTTDQGFASRYKERVNHLFVNGYSCKIESSETDHVATKVWYLPNKKKMRLIFDAAATSSGLNYYLLQGPDLLQSLHGITLRFIERHKFHRTRIREVDLNCARNTWPKGIVTRVFPGADGRIRTVEIKTKNGVLLTRPVTRLALLPVEKSVPEVTLGGECRRRTSRV